MSRRSKQALAWAIFTVAFLLCFHVVMARDAADLCASDDQYEGEC